MGGSGGFGLGFGAAGVVRADGAGGLWAGGFDAAGGLRDGGLRVGGLGAVANKTPPTLQKQAGSGGLHQIMTQGGS